MSAVEPPRGARRLRCGLFVACLWPVCGLFVPYMGKMQSKSYDTHTVGSVSTRRFHPQPFHYNYIAHITVWLLQKNLSTELARAIHGLERNPRTWILKKKGRHRRAAAADLVDRRRQDAVLRVLFVLGIALKLAVGSSSTASSIFLGLGDHTLPACGLPLGRRSLPNSAPCPCPCPCE